MTTRNEFDHSTLNWVKKELDETLKQAAEALEAFTEDPADSSQLRFCAAYLHQVQGILQMLELFGASLLAEEMEGLAEALLNDEVGAKQDAYEVLMRAILQLSDYLERVQGGFQDLPILIMPLLNDLRAARGAKLLSENALFSPDVRLEPLPRLEREEGTDLGAVAKSARHTYQRGLLGVLRDRDPQQNYGLMLDTLDRLDEASDSERTAMIWWVAAGLIDSLKEGGVNNSTATKMLLGQVDRHIKRVIDHGSASNDGAQVEDLIKNLLYYVALAEPINDRIRTIQSQYDLKRLVPNEHEAERAREGLFGPNADILESVSNAIKEDLAGVKDTLDLFVRGSQGDAARFEPALEALGRVADTLGVLGLGVPRRVVGEQIDLIRQWTSGDSTPDEQALMKVAEALLYVESSLDDLADRPGGASEEEPAEDSPGDSVLDERKLFDNEYRRVYGSAIREVLADVALVKDAIVGFIDNPSVTDLSGLPERFDGIRGALALVGLDRAAWLWGEAGRYVTDMLVPSLPVPDAEQLDDLADALTGIEYYLEAVVENRSHREQILDVAASSLEKLGYGGNGPGPDSGPGPEPDDAGPPDIDFGIVDESEEGGQDTGVDADADVWPFEGASSDSDDDEAESTDLSFSLDMDGAASAEESIEPPDRFEAGGQSTDASSPPVKVHEQSTLPTSAARIDFGIDEVGSELDEEILGIFLEEAEEVLGTLREMFPRWRANPEDRDALTTCRRMFHTLKGSGRLAGALLLGELAWSVENLMNRILDHTVPVSSACNDVVEAVIGVVPGLINQLRTGEDAPTDVRALMERAAILADPGRQSEWAPPSEESAKEVTDADSAIPDSGDRLDESEALAATGEEWASDGMFAIPEVDQGVSNPRDSEAPSASEPVEWTLLSDGGDIDDGGEADYPGPEVLEPTDSSNDVVGSGDVSELEGAAADVRDDVGEPLLEDSTPDEPAGDHMRPASEPDLSLDAQPTGETALDRSAEPGEHAETDSLDTAFPRDEADAESMAFLDGLAVEGPPLAGSVDETPEADIPSPESTADAADPTATAAASVPEHRNLDDAAQFDVEDPIEEPAPPNAADSEIPPDFGVEPESDSHDRAIEDDDTGVEIGDQPGSPMPGAPLLDPVLYGIFSKETADHLAVIREFAAACEMSDTPCHMGAAVVRALHTLTGSARMAGVDPIARLGRALEVHAQHRFEFEQTLIPEDLSVLRRGADVIEAMVEAIADPDIPQPQVTELIDEVDSLPKAFPEEGGALPETPSRSFIDWHDDDGGSAGMDQGGDGGTDEGKHQAEAESPPEGESNSSSTVDADAATAAAGPGLVDLFLEEAEDILGFLDTTVQRWEEDPDDPSAVLEFHRSLHTLKGGARLAGFDGVGALCHVLETLSGDVQEGRVPSDDSFFNLLHSALDKLSDLVEQAKMGGEPEAPEGLLQRISSLRGGGAKDDGQAQPASPPEGDSELVDVFLEEAGDILGSTEETLHAWVEDPENSDLIIQLQRALHTLKGGARMAGFQPIANLSHAFETLLIGTAKGGGAVSPDLFDLLEQLQDRLVSLHEQARDDETLQEADDLLRAVGDFLGGEGDGPSVPASVWDQRGTPRNETAKDGAVRQQDMVRVRADLLDNLVNFAGEVSIYRSRLDQQVGSFRFNLTEFGQTVARLRDQLRTMEIETEAQILYRFEREHEGGTRGDFDPLELDRFSRIQELSRALGESVNDLASIENMLDFLSREAETLLLQQSRVNTELQDGLMRTRMVPFANLVPRMRRIVRQTAMELGKSAQLRVVGAQGEMDRTVLERVVPPLEHMLRNAVAHGIESPERRREAGKPESGVITVTVSREGSEVVLRVGDDGGGISLDAIRRKAIERGQMASDSALTDREVMQFILESGFSTAETVTQIAGRGVGMDVVNAEIKQLGGTLDIDSSPSAGTTFTIRLPFTLAINNALLCQAGDDVYAIPLTSIEGVVRITPEELEQCLAESADDPSYLYAGQRYELRSLTSLLGLGDASSIGAAKRIPVVLVQTGDHRLALRVDSLLGNREIVVKSLGPQISAVPGIVGATILGDGRVVLILDVGALIRLGASAMLSGEIQTQLRGREESASFAKPTIMVVDDSITMRKVAARLLERNNMSVLTAKDGVDAVALLQEQVPDAMLLDIEMPRMDGYELASHMRNDDRLKRIPIIMITSRTGDKHRQRAMEIGVQRYLGKPYQESELLENLQQILEESDAGG